MRTILFLVGMTFLLLGQSVQADINVFEFREEEKREQFYDLIEEIRCPKCQNQNVADSNAPIAEDIKNRTYQWVNEGKSNDEIIDLLVDRFGDFVTYRPQMKGSTYILWFGPAVLFFVVAIILILSVKRKSASSSDEISAAQVDEERLKKILEKNH